MKFLITLLLVLFFINVTQAQVARITGLNGNTINSSVCKAIPSDKSTFTNKEWEEYTFYLSSEDTVTFKAQYDLKTDMFYLQGLVYRGISGKRVVGYRTKNNSNMLYQNSQYQKTSKKLPRGFYREIVDGKYSFISTIVLKKIPEASSTYMSSPNETKEDRFKMEIIYMLATDNRLEEAESKKKKLAKAFPEKRKEVELFIDENDLDLKSEEGLKAVFEYVNSL